MNELFENKISLHFDPEFYKEEVKCEYRISEKAKRVMAVELDLLHQLDVVCKSLGIKYFVYCGTLLGAVRHQGFIPWDDDIDVAMLREDYEKFIKLAPTLFKPPYFLQTALTDRCYFLGYARLRNSETTGLILKQASKCYNNGIYIDIFVLDGFVSDEKLLQKQLRTKAILTSLAELYSNHTIEANNQSIKFLKKFLHYTFCQIIPYRVIVNLYNKNLSKYNNTADRLTILTHKYELLTRYWCRKEDIKNIVFLSFENLMVPAPANFKLVLSSTYGDFMKFPPVEKRGAWHEGVLELDPDTPYVEYIEKRNKIR